MTTAIVVAGGKGRRMRGDVPKQYLSLNGIPVIGRTLLVFDACPQVTHLVLVVPETDLAYCRSEILDRLSLDKKVHLTAGGPQRQDSVYNGLLKSAETLETPEGLVAIHDGVRPLVAPDQLSACIRHAKTSAACILAVPAFDTLKQIDMRNRITATLKRETVWMAQTPQVFRHDLILKAHENARSHSFVGTDDAQLVERLGVPVTVLPGSRHNIKITTAEDLALARAWLKGGWEF